MSSADPALAGRKQAIPSPARGQSAVVCVIRHTIIPGKDVEYEAWLREIVPVAGSAEGHRGVNVIRPHTGSRTYTIALHFDVLEHLEQWLASEVWKRLILKVQHLLQEGDDVEIRTGLEFWFRPPDSGQKHAKPYKQFLITLSAIFPLTMLVPWLLTPLFRAAPILRMPGITHFLVATGIVALMTYVIMPRYTRLMAAWLYR
jgi:antibiotic biosynthesis monooxygenase (ABM) superfamily enzyme